MILDEREDAYGAAIRDHHAGEETVEIIERDDGWIGISAGTDLYFSEYDAWSDSERAAVARAEGRVLDVGCGAGRHALYLQKRGHEVVGIDVSPGTVEVSRDRGVDARPLDVAEVRELDAEPFETVVMFGNNFGLVGTRATAPRVLGGLAAVTTDDARSVRDRRPEPHHVPRPQPRARATRRRAPHLDAVRAARRPRGVARGRRPDAVGRRRDSRIQSARRDGGLRRGTAEGVVTLHGAYPLSWPRPRMDCRQCGTPLDRPGDFCLTCRAPNTDAVVLDLARERATVTCLYDGEVVAQRAVTTHPEDDPEQEPRELRNFAGLVADEVHRKRPEEVYAGGDRDVLDAVRGELHYSLYRVADDDPVEAVRARQGDAPLEVVDKSVGEKIGGSHSTLIGDRAGRRAIQTVGGHPHVKKIIPGPIDAGGSGSRSGVRAKATRADTNGNVRLLLRDGSSVQENRVVTTAGDREMGEHVRDDLNDALRDAELQEN